jgi:Protein of unknown function (DUF429)
MTLAVPVLLAGIDFSSSPSRRKPIVIATGQLRGEVVVVTGLEPLATLEAFGHWLQREPSWLAGCDFPFGLPRELVQHLGWPLEWLPLMRHYAALPRAQIRELFAAFCDGRPAGAKFAHRATDRPAHSSPSMKWVNPPVAWMMHAGVPCLLEAGAHLPGLHQGDPRRVALEAYPALLAREALLGAVRSYKSDDLAKQDQARLIARKDILTSLEAGRTRLGLRLKLSHAQRDTLVDDARGDRLDAVLCLMQAAWAASQGAPRYGLPAQMDPLEGWILTA